MKQIDDINQNLKSLGNPKETKTFRSTLRATVRTKPIALALSLILGFGLTSLIIFGILTVDAEQWIRSNLGTFIIAATALSAFIAGIFIKS